MPYDFDTEKDRRGTGAIKWEVQTARRCFEIQCPLRQGADNGQTTQPTFDMAVGRVPRLPVTYGLPGLFDVGADCSAELADQCSQVGQHLGVAKQPAQLPMGWIEQVFSNVGYEMLMTGQYRDG